jgi:hypothetical protein
LEWFPKSGDADLENGANWRFLGKGIGIHCSTWMKIYYWKDYQLSCNAVFWLAADRCKQIAAS